MFVDMDVVDMDVVDIDVCGHRCGHDSVDD